MNTDTAPISSAVPSTADIQTLLQTAPNRPWWRRPVVLASVAAVLLALGATYALKARSQARAAPSYVSETVQRGNLTLSVSANGTLQPTRSVNIGSELSGTVRNVLVDVNDRVRKGQLLVELDTAKLNDQLTKTRATLSAAQAKVAQTVVTVKEAQASLARLEEVSRLSGGKVPAKSELDGARATLERAQADEASARANVTEAQAGVSSDTTNLAKASIRSPIDGVVLTRSVEPGNAVAASLQAVTLFSVAEDLSKLRLQVNVDEADVGSVKVGQKASFTVSAYPSRKFPATITRVAYGSTTTENVVTYITYLEVDNSDLTLRPGMTATATITATERKDALLVPNTALRYSPGNGAGTGKPATQSSIVGNLMPRMPSGSGSRKSAGAAAGSDSKQVWVLRDGAPVAVPVQTGISDGRITEVTGGELTTDMRVITDQRSGGATQ
ncbi:MAG: efflux RND transporter periplasmic adaptor subunit [Rhodoferax sp.]|uniref:efflux RND transporter periplasmic adaptor subunit n=1 Tax=Rhodoferax sp. TaxID=50421 RepID=UPI002ACDB732|nr:efflux RND transporter periplasmic adaptor subunit [Rhodoferax sp.]MDZ7891515.1 efflux RND transporter periplasmic adaptor subunit [Rhodoferax sp.]